MVFFQYNLRLRRNQLLNKTPQSNNIVLDDLDPTSDWVVETQLATFDNEDLSWLDMDPLPHEQDVNLDVVQLPSGPGESSQAPNPHVESSHVEHVDDDSDSESGSEASESEAEHEDSDDYV